MALIHRGFEEKDGLFTTKLIILDCSFFNKKSQDQCQFISGFISATVLITTLLEEISLLTYLKRFLRVQLGSSVPYSSCPVELM